MNIFLSERLAYIPMEKNPRHDDFFYKLMSEPGAHNFDASLPVGISRGYVEAVTSAVASRRLLCMYVCLPAAEDGPEEPRPIGIVSLSKSNERQTHHGNTWLSLMIASEHQRQGYGREAASWAIAWAFNCDRLHRVEVLCYEWNPGAVRMFKDIGFIQEGVKREAIWYMGGWRDIHQLAILEHEWRREPRDSVTSEELAVVLGSA